MELHTTLSGIVQRRDLRGLLDPHSGFFIHREIDARKEWRKLFGIRVGFGGAAAFGVPIVVLCTVIMRSGIWILFKITIRVCGVTRRR